MSLGIYTKGICGSTKQGMFQSRFSTKTKLISSFIHKQRKATLIEQSRSVNSKGFDGVKVTEILRHFLGLEAIIKHTCCSRKIPFNSQTNALYSFIFIN